ncbi:unnamed protein product [Mytilus edulis]|uniref:Uncharacterized protein n=1 Tax=Mytilus edulis TaxID=6550 RepID=A0A8S3SJM3_MYTED|nr:unnamed protein product [Mytilus edulis]
MFQYAAGGKRVVKKTEELDILHQRRQEIFSRPRDAKRFGLEIAHTSSLENDSQITRTNGSPPSTTATEDEEVLVRLVANGGGLDLQDADFIGGVTKVPKRPKNSLITLDSGTTERVQRVKFKIKSVHYEKKFKELKQEHTSVVSNLEKLQKQGADDKKIWNNYGRDSRRDYYDSLPAVNVPYFGNRGRFGNGYQGKGRANPGKGAQRGT